MAGLAYTLGKREINYYFSVRSAKALALAAVLLLAACHAASRRYRVPWLGGCSKMSSCLFLRGVACPITSSESHWRKAFCFALEHGVCFCV